MYKLFDWYARVWIMTESTIIDMRWRWFAPNLLYIPYTKIEWIEVRTPSWIAGFFGMSDVVVKLIGQEEFSLPSASNTGLIVETLQQAAKWKKWHKTDEKEPFDILVDTLSDVVKWHLTTHGKWYITRDYVEKLDDTLESGVAIDLRTHEEKILIETWKEKYSEHEDEEENDEHTDWNEKNHH